jgi:glycosyltransferase involved in cell wall biosynthesis
MVQELSNQLKFVAAEGEIIVFDDFSHETFKGHNRSIISLEKVYYKELEKNYGRSRIRTLLAESARYEWLLFIDSDSAIINKNFLSNYVQALDNEAEVYIGGRVYAAMQPAACNKRLHWKYGTERESASGNTNALHTNNFCIRKDVFQQLIFPAELTGYGHEDTWMEIELEQGQNKIQFIDNPVLHDGLENTPVFLEKTKNALKNLLALTRIFDEKTVRTKVNLFNLYFWQRELGLNKIISTILKKRISKIETNLLSCNPSIFNFDLYRLYYLTELAKQNSRD